MFAASTVAQIAPNRQYMSLLDKAKQKNETHLLSTLSDKKQTNQASDAKKAANSSKK